MIKRKYMILFILDVFKPLRHLQKVWFEVVCLSQLAWKQHLKLLEHNMLPDMSQFHRHQPHDPTKQNAIQYKEMLDIIMRN